LLRLLLNERRLRSTFFMNKSCHYKRDERL
jgi:hypothetical protein